MTVSQRVKGDSPFTRWTVALGCLVSTTVEGGIWYSLGIFFNPLAETFDWSRAETSATNTSFMLSFAIAGFVLSRFADRYGPRVTMVGAAVLSGAGLALSGAVTELYQLILAYILLGIGLGPTFVVPTATIQRWFVKRRGAMLGMVISGVGLGAFIYAPIVNLFISLYGWRLAFVIVAVISGMGLLVAAVTISHGPEKKGLKPYGWEECDVTAANQLARPYREFAFQEALSTGVFWWLLLAIVMGQMPLLFLSVHIVPYATDQGVSRAATAGAVGLLGILSVAGRLTMGVAADRLGWKRSFILANYASAVAVMALLAIRTPATLYLTVGAYGFFYGTRMPPLAGLAGYFFGTRSLGSLLGLLIGVGNFMGAFAPLIAGLLFDRLGSYQTIIILSALSFTAGGFILHFIHPPRQPRGATGIPNP
ncbi:MAG: MFS transporter [Dehalococcoidia bacterium]|nr:MFS transporter [Dehalococcoidia bacterium]MDP7239823.1 MFS transporter [Dehalococcoidia bacterium]